jgi:hypothetical protein
VFQRLDEVLNYYNQKYQDTNDDFIIITPGYSEEEIDNLSEALGVEIPLSFRRVLAKANFCEFLGFKSLFVDVCIESLKYHNLNPIHISVLRAGYLQIGDSTGYIVLLKLETEQVFVQEFGVPENVFVSVNVEQFICRAATVVEFGRLVERNRVETMAAIDVFLIQNDIIEGRKFWNSLARGAA